MKFRNSVDEFIFKDGIHKADNEKVGKHIVLYYGEYYVFTTVEDIKTRCYVTGFLTDAKREYRKII